MNRNIAWAALAAGLALTTPLAAQSQQPAVLAQPPIKIGIVTFLTGRPPPVRYPRTNATEILTISQCESFRALQPSRPRGPRSKQNTSTRPARPPAGHRIRNLVQRDKVDVVVGYVSSGIAWRSRPWPRTQGAHGDRRLRNAALVRGKAAQIRLPREPARNDG
jgi:hypothetical protein